MNPKILTTLLVVIVALCAVAAYQGSARNGFIWDDPIVLNQQMVAFKSIGDAFVPPQNIPQFGVFYYRPLGVVSYMFDKAFSGPNPMDREEGSLNPFHVSVVIYHMIVTILVFVFGRLLFSGRSWGEWAAFAGAALFAVHPIHTESVCWMAGRSDILAALGLLPAMILFLVGIRRKSPGWLIAAAAFYLVGLWGKETAIAVLITLPLLELAAAGDGAGAAADAGGGASAGVPDARNRGKGRKRGERRRSAGRTVPARSLRTALPLWVRYGPFAAATVVYWMMRRADLGRQRSRKTATEFLFATNLETQQDRFFSMIGDLAGSLGFYLKKVLWPTHLTAFIADRQNSPALIALGIAGIAAALLVARWSWRRGQRVGAVLVGLFFATLAPSLAIAVFNISEAPVAERYLYIPSVAVCLGVAWAVGLVIEWTGARWGRAAGRAVLAVAVTGCVAVFGLFAMTTIERNEVWKDDLSFWEDTVAKAPHQGLPHLHLGLVYDRMTSSDPAEMRRFEEKAEQEFLLALDEKNVIYDVEGRSTAWNDLANVYLAWEEWDKAREAFLNAIRLRPGYHTPHYGLGLLNYRLALREERRNDRAAAIARLQEAKEWLNKAISLNPRYTKAFLLQGTVMSFLGENTDAMRYLQEVVRLEPGTSLAGDAQKLIDEITARSAATAGAGASGK